MSKQLLQKNNLRNRIIAFEKELSGVPGAVFGDQPDMPLIHEFAPGIYVRTISIPKGWIVVGKIHKHEHPSFLMKGECLVVTESGGLERIKAPLRMISPAETKRVVYTIENTVWTTIHLNPTDTHDLEKLEDEIILPDYTNVLTDAQYEKIELIQGGEQ